MPARNGQPTCNVVRSPAHGRAACLSRHIVRLRPTCGLSCMQAQTRDCRLSQMRAEGDTILAQGEIDDDTGSALQKTLMRSCRWAGKAGKTQKRSRHCLDHLGEVGASSLDKLDCYVFGYEHACVY